MESRTQYTGLEQRVQWSRRVAEALRRNSEIGDWTNRDVAHASGGRCCRDVLAVSNLAEIYKGGRIALSDTMAPLAIDWMGLV